MYPLLKLKFESALLASSKPRASSGELNRRDPCMEYIGPTFVLGHSSGAGPSGGLASPDIFRSAGANQQGVGN